jgi:hypothetical protein
MDDEKPLARCPVRGCPYRWRRGPDRMCAEHEREVAVNHGERLAAALMVAPRGVTGKVQPAMAGRA